MTNKHFVFIGLMLCLIGCVAGEEISIPRLLATATATRQQTPTPLVATETAVLPTVTSTATIRPTELATAVWPTDSPTATPTQPTATSTPSWEADFFEGLILASPYDFEALSIIKDNAPLPLTRYESGQLLPNGKWLGYATKDEKVYYTIRNGRIIEFSATGQTQLSFDERIPQTIFGIVNDWLILSSFPLDWTVQQEMGNLTAVSLSTFETIIISDERPYITPIVAPDGSEVIYWENDTALSWRGEGQIEKRPFPQFRSGAISQNGEFVAMLLSGEIHIYNLQTNQLVYQESFANCPGDGFCFPVWHPNNRQVAYGVYIPEHPPSALRLISLDGPAQQFDGANFPAFSPDGEWMAVYRNVSNEPETAVIHLTTGEILDTPFSGIPIHWTDT
jgi:hypothetical protein